MRAKVSVRNVEINEGAHSKYSETVEFVPVTDSPFDGKGNSEDNTYARWTPSGSIKLDITNPSLWEKFEQYHKYYVDFTPAD